MLPRFLVSSVLGALTAFGLLWAMQALVSVSMDLHEAGRRLSIEFVRLRRDTTPEIKEREPPRRQKPEQQPAPPAMNMAQNINPGEAVGEIVPIADSGLELESATSLSTGASGDSDVVPLVRVEPEYPERAKRQRIEGWVEIEFTISPAGTVKDARVIGAQPSYVFDRAALRAVGRWRYAPKVEDGKAVERPGVQVRLRFDIPKGR